MQNMLHYRNFLKNWSLLIFCKVSYGFKKDSNVGWNFTAESLLGHHQYFPLDVNEEPKEQIVNSFHIGIVEIIQTAQHTNPSPNIYKQSHTVKIYKNNVISVMQ